MVEYEQRELPYMRLFEELEPLEKLEVCVNHWSGRRHSWIREKYHLDPTVDIAHECAKWIEARDGVERGIQVGPRTYRYWVPEREEVYAIIDEDEGILLELVKGSLPRALATARQLAGDHNKIVAKVVGKYEYIGGGA